MSQLEAEYADNSIQTASDCAEDGKRTIATMANVRSQTRQSSCCGEMTMILWGLDSPVAHTHN
eukprot:COSAG05_NODE_233_length_13251_cov_30.223920_2_plen_63_part_00